MEANEGTELKKNGKIRISEMFQYKYMYDLWESCTKISNLKICR